MTTTPQHPQSARAEQIGAHGEARFSRRLAALTAAQHEEAENSVFMQDLLGGRLDLGAYSRLAGQLSYVYSALESRGRELTGDPIASAVIDPRLDRSMALEVDLVALAGHQWRARHPALAATSAYAARITQADGPAYLAHHYVRYLGDLSGGFVVARMVSRAYGLTPGAPGLLFHHFPEVPKPKPYKDAYRARLDEAASSLTPGEQERVIAEAQAAFADNTALFTELSRPLAA